MLSANGPYRSNSGGASYIKRPVSPLTKRVDEMHYDCNSHFNRSSWATPPEFLKVFGDCVVPRGERLELECVLFGNPRPRITWLFNGHSLPFEDAECTDTCDAVRLVIRRMLPHHYGYYTVIGENEVGQATASATIMKG